MMSFIISLMVLWAFIGSSGGGRIVRDEGPRRMKRDISFSIESSIGPKQLLGTVNEHHSKAVKMIAEKAEKLKGFGKAFLTMISSKVTSLSGVQKMLCVPLEEAANSNSSTTVETAQMGATNLTMEDAPTTTADNLSSSSSTVPVLNNANPRLFVINTNTTESGKNYQQMFCLLI